MSDAYFVVEEYLWFNEYQQGNVNVAGLVFDDLIEETLELGREDVLTVFSEQIADSFEFSESFAPLHFPVCSETFNIYEFFGTPLRVRQSVVNLIMKPPLVAAKIAAVHLDILHGIDIYWEEVSSEVMLRTTYANAVPYYWEYMYESFDIDMTEPQPEPPVFLSLKLAATDIVNMRHSVEQEYFFNSKCLERFFMWDDQIWGWSKTLVDEIKARGDVQEIIGKVAHDYMDFKDQDQHTAKTTHLLTDYFFTFDIANDEKYYLLTAGDVLDVTDNDPAWAYDVGLVEVLSMGGLVAPNAVFGGLATESLVFADVMSFAHDVIIEEGIEMGDVELAKWTCQVLLASGFDLTDIIG